MQSVQQSNTQPIAAPAPRKNILAKAAIFNNVKEEQNIIVHVPKQLDRSKTEFLKQNNQNETISNVNAAEEINQLRQKAATEEEKVHKVEDVAKVQEEIYENYEQIQSNRQQAVVEVVFVLLLPKDFS